MVYTNDYPGRYSLPPVLLGKQSMQQNSFIPSTLFVKLVHYPRSSAQVWENLGPFSSRILMPGFLQHRCFSTPRLFSDCKMAMSFPWCSFLFWTILWLFICGSVLTVSARDQHKPQRSVLRRTHLRRPNVLLVLTDDQDVELGSMYAMKKTRQLMEEGGAHFPNAFVTTPICCPSRSSILTGKYTHNHNVYTNNENCSSRAWQAMHESQTFAVHMQNAGYSTGFFGKYLNEYNGNYVPQGWRHWLGQVKNARFYNYTLNRNGMREQHGFDYSKDYLTDLITNESIDFFRHSRRVYPTQPILMVLSHAAPHGPEDVAPQYSTHFSNISSHITPSYNKAPNQDKHWILRHVGLMLPIHMDFTNALHRRRLQTLLSVDDSVYRICRELERAGELENTYVVYTSDHGYHLGQFGLVKGKSMPYEFDIRVPLYVRGPGVLPGSVVPQIALNIDLAPTLLDMAGLDVPSDMDGRSLLSLLKSQAHHGDRKMIIWRDSFLVEKGRLRKKYLESKSETLATHPVPSMTLQQAICLRGKHWRPCVRRDQQWHCKTSPTGRVQLHRCIDFHKSGHSQRRARRAVERGPRCCSCSQEEDQMRMAHRFRMTRRLRLLDRDIGSEGPSFAEEGSGDGSFLMAAAVRSVQYRVPTVTQLTSRCSLLENKTITCDGQLHSSLDRWRNHKKQLDEQIKMLNQRLEILQRVRGHLKRIKPEECICRERSSVHRKGRRKHRRKEQRGRRSKKDSPCRSPGVVCFSHDNDHWRTPPYWTHGNFCACTTSVNNTYWCLRTINETHNILFCKFITGFIEYFDLNSDPYQLQNVAATLTRAALNELLSRLAQLRRCRGQRECDSSWKHRPHMRKSRSRRMT
uniref:extracellular sulfatase Sulf-2-like n=1 Tax=Myxine glutinosa TaxID=7769 RepID=UPI00358DFB30